MKTALQDRVRKSVEEAREIVSKSEEEGRKLSDEEHEKLSELKGDRKDALAKLAEYDADDELVKHIGTFGDPADQEAAAKAAEELEGDLNRPGDGKTIGERVWKSEAWQTWLKSGALSAARIGTGPAVALGGMKDVISGSEASGTGSGGQSLVPVDDIGLQDMGTFMRPLTLFDLITRGTTGSDTVEFARVNGFTNAAAPTAEATGSSAGTASGDVTGQKPESALTFEKVVETVKSIPHWIPATKRALADAGQLRTLIDAFLRYGLEEELEDQIMTGDGTGENVTGIYNTDGIQTVAFDTDPLVTARKAITAARVNGRVRPTAFGFHPNDNETIDLQRDANDNFFFGGPARAGVQTLWGLPRTESEALTEGRPLVADWRMAVLWDREAISVQASDSHEDFFTRNLVAILAEMRAAFGVLRPEAFVEFEMAAAS